jgi:hypothetical protein
LAAQKLFFSGILIYVMPAPSPAFLTHNLAPLNPCISA